MCHWYQVGDACLWRRRLLVSDCVFFTLQSFFGVCSVSDYVTPPTPSQPGLAWDSTRTQQPFQYPVNWFIHKRRDTVKFLSQWHLSHMTTVTENLGLLVHQALGVCGPQPVPCIEEMMRRSKTMVLILILFFLSFITTNLRERHRQVKGQIANSSLLPEGTFNSSASWSAGKGTGFPGFLSYHNGRVR